MAQRSFRLAVVLASVLTATAAGAQTQGRAASQPAEPLVFGTGATYEVKFDDDPLEAVSKDGTIPRIEVIGRWPHARLHRPRTQFVSEMLKSVDAI
jgi:hypothetical protein